jgi:hypothetical protein
MPLLPILATNPQEIYALDLRQVVALCGNGRLTDGSECSQELRAFFKDAPSEHLFRYVETCLDEGFDKSGQVLQDIINELGRRLDFDVQNGNYSGRQNSIGFDGIWGALGARALVVEVKTTDAYRINLDTVASYRMRLIDAGQLGRTSSILIVVGRQDTGDLEAQIRGSRHAWDIRLISADSLIKLVKIKEDAEESTVARIRELLVPFEYTRIDRIIELAFTAVTEIGDAIEKEEAPVADEPPNESALSATRSTHERTPKEVIEALRQKIIAALSMREGVPLIKKSRALYWSTDIEREVRVACTISKHYEKSDSYWYAYHTDWNKPLSGAQKGYYVLGCSDIGTGYSIPLSWIQNKLQELYTSDDGGTNPYWHIHLVRKGAELVLRGDRSGRDYPISEFAVSLGN